MFVRIGELRDDGEGKFSFACEPLGDNAWVPSVRVQCRPRSGIEREECSPVPTNVCERYYLLGVRFGTNGKIEDLGRNLRGKSVRRGANVQKDCYAYCRCLRHLV